MTQLHDVVYVLCSRSSTVLRFDATTHHRLTNIDISGLMSPHDIVACSQTSRLYVADWECVWRVSSDGGDIRRWLPNIPSCPVKPWTLSVTSARLLVTSSDLRQLIQFDAGGTELRRIQLPCDVIPRHAVESPSGTFLLGLSNMELERDQVCELGTDGEVLRRFGSPSFRCPDHIDIDFRGNVFVADSQNCRILLLNAGLMLRRVIIDASNMNCRALRGLCYLEQTGRLLVALDNSIAVFDLLSR